MVELLLSWRAVVAAVDQSGRTALHWAAGEGHHDVIELLWARVLKGLELSTKIPADLVMMTDSESCLFIVVQ